MLKWFTKIIKKAKCVEIIVEEEFDFVLNNTKLAF